MFNIVNIIKEASLYHKNKRDKLNYIKEHYPHYYQLAKNYMLGNLDNLPKFTARVLNKTPEFLEESCNSKDFLETEDYMSSYFETNKDLQNVANYLNYYEVYNLDWNSSTLPVNDPEKLSKQIKKKSKENNKLMKSYNKLENNLTDGNYHQIKGLVTEYIGYCPKCKQIAFPNHKCNK